MEKFKEVLDQARKLEQSGQDLADQQARLLDPILIRIMREGNIAEAEHLVQQLPTGFHRTELRVWLTHQKEGS